MSSPSDPYSNLQAESNRHRLDLIETELALCFTFSSVAARRHETGKHESAARSMAKAEQAYQTVAQFLSDPKHSKHLTGEESKGITATLKLLRDRLDRLRQLKK